MANRRMFSKFITSSTRFLKMPASSQNLYFHLGMNADDDGIVEAFTVMRMIGANEDDLRVLVGKEFITILNEDLVSFVNDWLENNNIRSDRKIDSVYKELLLEIKPDAKIKKQHGNHLTDNRLPNDGQVTDKCQPKDRIGKVRLGKVRLGKDSIGKDSIGKDREEKDRNTKCQQIADLFNATCLSFPQIKKITASRKEEILSRLEIFTIEDFKAVFELAETSDFLRGKKGTWKANFDWLIEEQNMIKVLEGNYNEPEKKKNKKEDDIIDYYNESYESPEEFYAQFIDK